MKFVDLEIFYTPAIGIIYKKSLELIKPKKNEILLDIGGGYGKFCRRYEKFVKFAVVVDIDKNILKNKIAKNYVIADINNLPFKDSSVDIVLCQEVLEHILTPQKALNELSGIIKQKTGRIFLTTPNSEVIKKYNFPITRTLNKLPINWKNVPGFFSGDFIKIGYAGWKKKVGHVKDGFTDNELKCMSKKANLKIVYHDYLWKFLTKMFWELAFSNRFLNNLSKPITGLFHIIETKIKKVGLSHMLLLKKI